MNDNERRWSAAISNWFERDGSNVRSLLQDSSEPIPGFAREFLADLADDGVKRPSGRTKERYAWQERSFVAAYFAALEASKLEPKLKRVKTPTPKDHQRVALEVAAKQKGTSVGAFRGVVNRLIKENPGWTEENWRAWGRPDFSNTKP